MPTNQIKMKLLVLNLCLKLVCSLHSLGDQSLSSSKKVTNLYQHTQETNNLGRSKVLGALLSPLNPPRASHYWTRKRGRDSYTTHGPFLYEYYPSIIGYPLGIRIYTF